MTKLTLFDNILYECAKAVIIVIYMVHVSMQKSICLNAAVMHGLWGRRGSRATADRVYPVHPYINPDTIVV